MAKKPERKQKLKVFRTPIGFHDAYVAAPSQKAALEAWGADGNLFTQGIAEQVTDSELMEEPLANPGKVIKRVRGSTDEHFAALDRTARKPKSKAQAEDTAPKAKPKPRPRRDELDAAEQALEKVEKKQRKKLVELDERIRELARNRRDLQRKHEAERDELAEERDRARSAYDRAMEAWRSAG